MTDSQKWSILILTIVTGLLALAVFYGPQVFVIAAAIVGRIAVLGVIAAVMGAQRHRQS